MDDSIEKKKRGRKKKYDINTVILSSNEEDRRTLEFRTVRERSTGTSDDVRLLSGDGLSSSPVELTPNIHISVCDDNSSEDIIAGIPDETKDDVLEETMQENDCEMTNQEREPSVARTQEVGTTENVRYLSGDDISSQDKVDGVVETTEVSLNKKEKLSDETATVKKRGRKPKGGKLVIKQPEQIIKPPVV